MNIEEFNYDLPEELIAQTPLENRSASRLMVVDKKTGKITQLQTSLQAAQKADAVIVCIGELAEQSGESKSKTNIEVI